MKKEEKFLSGSKKIAQGSSDGPVVGPGGAGYHMARDHMATIERHWDGAINSPLFLEPDIHLPMKVQ